LNRRISCIYQVYNSGCGLRAHHPGLPLSGVPPHPWHRGHPRPAGGQQPDARPEPAHLGQHDHAGGAAGRGLE